MEANFKACTGGKYGPKVEKVSARPYLVIAHTGKKKKNCRKGSFCSLNSYIKIKISSNPTTGHIP